MNESEHKATLSFSDGTPSVDFPILKGSIGPDVIDIRKLYAQTGKFTYDTGFLSTASCASSITYIDGDQGQLLYRGYPIEQLAVHCEFLEVCYLIYYGELPNASQFEEFKHLVMHHTMVHEQMQFAVRGFRRDSHPMAVLTSLAGSMAAFYPDSLDINSPEQQDISFIRLVAKMPTLVAMAYKYSIGQPNMYPQNDLSYTANFMHMMFATPCEKYTPNPVLVRALDRIFTLHAEHEQNASTSTVRLCGSSGTSPFSAIAAGVACLWGPAHGGANQASPRDGACSAWRCLGDRHDGPELGACDEARRGHRNQPRRAHLPCRHYCAGAWYSCRCGLRGCNRASRRWHNRHRLMCRGRHGQHLRRTA